MDKMIVYEDDDLLVADKPAGIATETARVGQADIVSVLKNYMKKSGGEPYIGVVHRLDQPVGGLLVFAKNPKTAGVLGTELRNGRITKKYAAIVAGMPGGEEGELCDYLLKDARTNLSRVVPEGTGGAKEARLRWKLLDIGLLGAELLETRLAGAMGLCSLVEIELCTGRHHQIRVQMANAGFPLLGDAKYGSEQSRRLSDRLSLRHVALLARELCLVHPATGLKMEFSLDFGKLL